MSGHLEKNSQSKLDFESFQPKKSHPSLLVSLKTNSPIRDYLASFSKPSA